METQINYADHFRLLEPTGAKKQSFNLQMHVSGYNDTMHYLSSLIKVCILALEGQEVTSSPYVPQPEVNIVAVLEVILNLIPYEESELLDLLHARALDPVDHEMELLEMNLWLRPQTAVIRA